MNRDHHWSTSLVDQWRHHLLVIRLSLALFLLWPVFQFIGLYWWEHRTLQHVEQALVVAAVDGALVSLIELVNDPIRGLLLLGLFSLIGRIAFGPPKRRRGWW